MCSSTAIVANLPEKDSKKTYQGGATKFQRDNSNFLTTASIYGREGRS
jgi:hypothetical protein